MLLEPLRVELRAAALLGAAELCELVPLDRDGLRDVVDPGLNTFAELVVVELVELRWLEELEAAELRTLVVLDLGGLGAKEAVVREEVRNEVVEGPRAAAAEGPREDVDDERLDADDDLNPVSTRRDRSDLQ